MYSDEYNNEEMNQDYEETSSNNTNNSSSSKKMLWIVIAAIVLVLIVILYLWLGGGDDKKKPEPIIPQITISNQKENLSLGNSLPLKAIVTNIQNATVVWTSSNEAVATVDNMGNVTGVNEGTTIITATYVHTDNQPYSISCEVTVVKGDPNVPLTNVKFPEGEVLISEGAEYQIQVIFEPADAYAANTKYTSTDEAIVTVDENGKIKAIREGEANIRLNVNDGDFADQITVNVTKEQVTSQIFIPVDSIEFDKALLTLEVGGDPVQLSYKILPTNALSSNLDWESSDPTVATVEEGIVSPLKVGTTIITVKSLDGITAIMTVEVEEKEVPVTGVEVLNENKTISLKVGETSPIVANVLPSNATNKEISYKSDKESVATVDAVTGLITAISKGTATITLTSKENSKITNKITVTVTTNSTNTGPGSGGNSSSINLTDIKVKLGSTHSVLFSSLGLKENVSVVSCTLGNTGYANVKTSDSECIITPKSIGVTTFTVRISTGASKTVKLTVVDNEQGGSNDNANVTGVSLNKTSLTLNQGNIETLIATVSPTNATNKSVTWSSSNPQVVTVDGDGKVTARSSGTATITVTTSNGKKATCTVTVPSTTTTVAVTNVTLNKTSLTLNKGATETLTATVSPTNATNKSVTWSSSNTSVATVDTNGKVTAVASGTATITATANDSSGKQGKCTLTVTASGTTDGSTNRNCTWERESPSYVFANACTEITKEECLKNDSCMEYVKCEDTKAYFYQFGYYNADYKYFFVSSNTSGIYFDDEYSAYQRCTYELNKIKKSNDFSKISVGYDCETTGNIKPYPVTMKKKVIYKCS